MHVYPPVHRFDFAPKHWRQRSGDQWGQDRDRGHHARLPASPPL
nr:MAG TPA: hypothetical protein [Caudoviricetes sp.]